MNNNEHTACCNAVCVDCKDGNQLFVENSVFKHRRPAVINGQSSYFVQLCAAAAIRKEVLNAA